MKIFLKLHFNKLFLQQKQKTADAHNNHILPTLLKIEKKFVEKKTKFLVGDVSFLNALIFKVHVFCCYILISQLQEKYI